MVAIPHRVFPFRYMQTPSRSSMCMHTRDQTCTCAHTQVILLYSSLSFNILGAVQGRTPRPVPGDIGHGPWPALRAGQGPVWVSRKFWATFLGEIGKIPEKSADLGEVPGVWSMVGPVFPDVGLKLLYNPGRHDKIHWVCAYMRACVCARMKDVAATKSNQSISGLR